MNAGSRLGRMAIAGLCLGWIGCGSDPDGAADTGADSTGPSGSDALTTGATASVDSTSLGSTSTGPSTSQGSTSAGPSTGPDDTTGASAEICDIIEADEANFEMEHNGDPLPANDATVTLICGGQGSFMFYFPVDIYGVDTMGEQYVTFEVTMDVEGFNDVGANGHFIDRQFSVYVGCEKINGDSSALSVVLPDAITDESVLHDVPYVLEVVMMPGQADERTLTSNGTLSAVDAGRWRWCQCGGFGGECPSETTGTSSDSGTSGDSGTSSTGG